MPLQLPIDPQSEIGVVVREEDDAVVEGQEYSVVEADVQAISVKADFLDCAGVLGLAPKAEFIGQGEGTDGAALVAVHTARGADHGAVRTGGIEEDAGLEDAPPSV